MTTATPDETGPTFTAHFDLALARVSRAYGKPGTDHGVINDSAALARILLAESAQAHARATDAEQAARLTAALATPAPEGDAPVPAPQAEAAPAPTSADLWRATMGRLGLLATSPAATTDMPATAQPSAAEGQDATDTSGTAPAPAGAPAGAPDARAAFARAVAQRGGGA